MNIKVGELYSQYRPTLYFYSLRLVNVVWIVTRVVWGGDNTCGKKTFKLLQKIMVKNPNKKKLSKNRYNSYTVEASLKVP